MKKEIRYTTEAKNMKSANAPLDCFISAKQVDDGNGEDCTIDIRINGYKLPLLALVHNLEGVIEDLDDNELLDYTIDSKGHKSIKIKEDNNLKVILRKFFCKIGWHSLTYDLVETPKDHLQRYKCKWCGLVGLKDSQGNLFPIKGKEDK